jgi:hypothetical protein
MNITNHLVTFWRLHVRLILALWYCAIYPGSLFLCSFSLLVMYFVDRFSLMRTWKRAPHLGSKISQFSRRYVFPIAIAAMAIVSSYYWASFPFDNLCETERIESTDGSFTFQVSDKKGEEVQTYDDITLSNVTYQYCLQDFFRYPHFPFVPQNQIEGAEWMTDDQEIVSNIYGYSAIFVVCIVLLSIVWKWYLGFMAMFRGTYQPCGDDMGVNLSDVISMNSYVPQISSPVFSYPLLASNIDNFDIGLLDWTDPDRPHSYYDLTKDAEVLLRGKEFGKNIVFSQIAHWPPPGKEKKKKKKKKPKHIAGKLE